MNTDEDVLAICMSEFDDAADALNEAIDDAISAILALNIRVSVAINIDRDRAICFDKKNKEWSVRLFTIGQGETELSSASLQDRLNAAKAFPLLIEAMRTAYQANLIEMKLVTASTKIFTDALRKGS
jgi:hypothetical protein